MKKDDKILITGRKGQVGSAIERKLRTKGFNNIVGLSSDCLDLRNQADTFDYFKKEKPDYVFLAAAKVGGILANINNPAVFLYDNLAIQNNVIEASRITGVKKLLFLASSCIYPRLAPQPMKEEYLMDGKLEPTNEGYALAKIAGLKLCEYYNKQYGTDYISVMPCNIYGYGDNFDIDSSHVIAALIRRFHEAKIRGQEKVVVWGTGKARREFMFVDDLADACLNLFDSYSGNDFYNVGTGKDIQIDELAELIKTTVGFEGTILFDSSKPDGMPRKLLDISKLKALGWNSVVSLEEGLKMTYDYYLNKTM